MNPNLFDQSGAEAREHEPDGYRLSRVHGCLDPTTARAIIAMWQSHNVLSPAEAQRRVTEVVYVAHDSRGDVIGVNTVYTALRPDDGLTYYFYRTFIRPGMRGNIGLLRTMLLLTYGYLKASRQGPVGLLLVTENPKLMRLGVALRLARRGFHRLGKDAAGRDVWGLNFDGGAPRSISPEVQGQE